MATVRLNVSGTGEGTVSVDGLDISAAVHSVTVKVAAREFTQVELGLNVLKGTAVEAEDATVVVPDATPAE